MSGKGDWKGKLAEWLTNHPKVMPDELKELREEFVRRFPKEKLGEMTLEQYALGHPGFKASFSYGLEFGTKQLGTMGGGPARKHGVWRSQKLNDWRCHKALGTENVEEALVQVKRSITAMVNAVQEEKFDGLDKIGVKILGSDRFSVSVKALYMYFPDKFLQINSLNHLKHFLSCFGEVPKDHVFTRNRQLLEKLRSLPEFGGFDTHQMMAFLYECLPPPKDPEDTSLETTLKGTDVEIITFEPPELLRLRDCSVNKAMRLS